MKVQDYDPVVDTAVGVAEDPSGNLKMLQVDANGKLKVDSNVDLSGATVNISGDLVADVNTIEETLGAKTDTAATEDTGTMSMVSLFKRGLAHLTSILGRIPSNLTVASNRLQVDTGTVPVTDNGGSLTVDGTVTANVTFPATQPVSATALPLPTGAATETTLSTLNTKIPTLTAASSRLLVDGSGVTQPVSGTVTATGPLTDTQLRATAVPVSGTVSVNIRDGSGVALTSAARGTERALSVQIVDGSGAQITSFGGTGGGGGAVTQSGNWSVRTQDGAGNDLASSTTAPAGTERGLITRNIPSGTQTVSGTVTANVSFPATQPVSATALPLPTGAATETTLSTLNTKIPTLTAASSRLLVDGSGVTQPVSGTVTATGPLTDTQLRATAVAVSGTVTATGPLTDTQLRASAVPVSGPLTDTQLRATAVPVSGPLTDSQLRASAVPVLLSSAAITETTGTAASTSTEVLASNSTRNYLLIQNLSTAPFHISFGGTASTSTLRIDGGGTLIFEGRFVPTSSVRMIRTEASQSYYIAHA
jgi:hypothetical protein